MTKPIIRIHDLATNEIIDREMNDAEYAQHLKDVAESEARKAEEETKAQAKAVAEGKLAALGLTVEDLKALGL